MVQPRKYFHPANVYNIYTLEHVEWHTQWVKHMGSM
jgi:hypothetical protein